MGHLTGEERFTLEMPGEWKPFQKKIGEGITEKKKHSRRVWRKAENADEGTSISLCVLESLYSLSECFSGGSSEPLDFCRQIGERIAGKKKHSRRVWSKEENAEEGTSISLCVLESLYSLSECLSGGSSEPLDSADSTETP